MIVVGAILTFLVIGFINSTFGFRASTEALSIASAGIDDALLQLTRNKDFSEQSGYCVPSDSCTESDALVVVTQNSPSTGFVSIISTARVDRRERIIKAVASVSSSTGQVQMISWNLVTQ